MAEDKKDTDIDDKKGEDTDKGSATKVTPQWEALGYGSEEEFVDQALKWQTEAEKSEELIKVRDKQAADFRRQSTRVGDLNKEVETLRDYKRSAETQGLKKPEDTNTPHPKPDEILDGLEEVQIKEMNEFLDKPENVELKKKVIAGGQTAMAEFAESYGQAIPPDLSKPVFGQKQTQPSSYDQSSITGMVKNAFRQMDNETKKKIPASESGGTIASEGGEKQTPVTGSVKADYFRAEKE